MVYSSVKKCPPGVVCISPTIFGALLAAIGGICVWLFSMQGRGYSSPMPLRRPETVEEQKPVSIHIAQELSSPPPVVYGGGDGRFQIAPKPERQWVTSPDLPSYVEVYGKLPRMPTRGLPETYQSMGVITTEDGKVLPLYGRRTTARSDRFQYYTRTDSYNPVQLPIQYKRRNCQDDIGCDELFDGESVKIQPTNQIGKATIYRFDGPTYIPGLI